MLIVPPVKTTATRGTVSAPAACRSVPRRDGRSRAGRPIRSPGRLRTGLRQRPSPRSKPRWRPRPARPCPRCRCRRTRPPAAPRPAPKRSGHDRGRRRGGPRSAGLSGAADDDRRDAGQRRPARPTKQQHDRRPDEVGDRPDDEDRQEAGHRHEHVQDAEDAAADVLRQVLLELGLGRDRHERVGDPGEEREADDERQQRRDGRQVRQAGRLAGAGEDVADLARAWRSPRARKPSTTRLPSITRRRGSSLPYALRSRIPMTMPMPRGRTTTTKSSGPRPSVDSAKARTEDAEHADERCRGREVDQRPADLAVAPDVRRGPRATGRRPT